jgi:hypothetical protein
MKFLRSQINLETKDCLMMTVIFAVTGHVLAAILCLVLVALSAHGDWKKQEQKKPDSGKPEDGNALEDYDRDDIQFPRLISMLIVLKTIDHAVIMDLAEEMDFDSHEVDMILSRAQMKWDRIQKEMP